MKSILLFFSVIASISAQSQITNFHDFTVNSISGEQINLSQYAGKKLLVVNTASYCGYTYQYANLQHLYDAYGGSGFQIIGFPCNDFGAQEPGSDSVIFEFCTGHYNVTFPMMSSIHIKTGDTADVYKWLQRGDLNGVADAAVTWNFNKFLIDEQGNWVRHFDSPVNPQDTAIVNWITRVSTPTGIKTSKPASAKVWLSQDKQLTLEFPRPIDCPGIIRLVSLTGQQLLAPFRINTGTSLSTVPLGDVSPGIYNVQVTIGNMIENHRVVILR